MANPLGLSSVMDGQALSFGAQSTVESVPVSPVVGGVAGYNVTTAGANGVASVQPNVAGVYRLTAYLVTNNGTTPSVTSLAATFNDGNSKAAQTVYFAETTAGTALNAASLANGTYTCTPLTVFADPSASIVVTYTAANTPNDHITVVIEQLA